MTTPLPPLALTGGAAAPAISEGGAIGDVVQKVSGGLSLPSVIGIVILGGAYLWLKRK